MPSFNKPTQKQILEAQVDICEVLEVDVQTAPDGRVWVNVDGICVLRIQRSAHTVVNGKNAKEL